MSWEQLRKDLLALPRTSEPGGRPLLSQIRGLTGNIFWEDLYPELDSHSATVVYLLKKVADDAFFNFGQDSSVPLDMKLEDGREANDHLGEALAPLVEFVQVSLSGKPLEQTVGYLDQAVIRYLDLVDRFRQRGGKFVEGGP